MVIYFSADDFASLVNCEMLKAYVLISSVMWPLMFSLKVVRALMQCADGSASPVNRHCWWHVTYRLFEGKRLLLNLMMRLSVINCVLI